MEFARLVFSFLSSIGLFVLEAGCLFIGTYGDCLTADSHVGGCPWPWPLTLIMIGILLAYVGLMWLIWRGAKAK